MFKRVKSIGLVVLVITIAGSVTSYSEALGCRHCSQPCCTPCCKPCCKAPKPARERGGHTRLRFVPSAPIFLPVVETVPVVRSSALFAIDRAFATRSSLSAFNLQPVSMSRAGLRSDRESELEDRVQRLESNVDSILSTVKMLQASILEQNKTLRMINQRVMNLDAK